MKNIPFLVLLCVTLGVKVHAETCLIRTNTEKCSLLMSSLTVLASERSCDCYDFCNGVWMGCGSSGSKSSVTTGRIRRSASSHHPTAPSKCENGEWVRGCTFATPGPIGVVEKQQTKQQQQEQQQEQRALQTSPIPITVVTASTDGCEAGFFRSDSSSQCVPCLSCGTNAFAKVTCVTYRPDPNQCECNPGYQPNIRNTGCLPIRNSGTTITTTTTTTGSPISSPMVAPSPPPTLVSRPISSTTISNSSNRPITTPPVVSPPTSPPINQSPVTITTSNGQTNLICPVGFFKSSPQATSPCIPCLSCGLNAFAKVTCVTYRPDPNQCECNPGYVQNERRTGCLPVANTTTTNNNTTTIAGGSIDGNNNNVCPMGMFKSSPESSSPCIPCLSCGLNAFAKVTCVTYRPDPNQCECNAGFIPNIRRTGCLPLASGGGSNSITATESIEMPPQGSTSNAVVNTKHYSFVYYASGWSQVTAMLLLGTTAIWYGSW